MYGYLYDFRYLDFIKGTAFISHYWILNFLILVIISGYVFFYLLVLKGKRIKKYLKILYIAFLVVSIYFFATAGFFEKLNSFAYIFGGILICIAVFAYLLEIMRSETIMQFYKELTFYVSVGCLIYYLSVIPIYIYQTFVQTSEEYRELYNLILTSLNFFLYIMFAIGFIVHYYSGKGSNSKRSVGTSSKDYIS